jgi:peptide/nickel transport system permease protein
LRLFAGKVVRLVLVLLVVTFFSFCMVKALDVKGDLVDKIIPFGTQAQKNVLRADLGLNDGFFAQYWHWLTHFVVGDFGNYYLPNPTPVSDSLSSALPISLELMLYAQVLSLIVAVPFGIATAYKAGSRFDGISNTVAFGLLALPNFVLALLLAIYVGAKWGWLPTQSNISPFPLSPIENWRYMLLPTISLAVGQIAIYMRLLRSDMIATLQEDFITTAKSKGIPTRRVLLSHALRPSSLTLLTVAGLNVGALIGGALVVERIFGLPGIGSKLTEAIFRQQYVAVQTYVAVIAVFYVVLNFLVDILYSVLDPRIRHARATA